MPFKPSSEALKKLIHDQWKMGRQAGAEEAVPFLAHLLSLLQTQPVSVGLLRALSGSTNRRLRYHSFSLDKKQGGARTIDAPDASLKWIQRSLLRALVAVARPHKCAHGFVTDKGILTHARIHAHSKWIFVTDIKDFFPSIHWGRIYGMLQSKPFLASAGLARLIANLVTHQGRLPQGAPTSPFLSNIITLRMDHRLLTWAREHGFRYSRYADDLTFSTNKPAILNEERDEIEAIVIAEGFVINEAKRRTVPNEYRQRVTGLVVNSARPNVPRERVKNLRALLHNIVRHGWQSQTDRRLILDSPAERAAYFKAALQIGRVRAITKEQREGHLLIRSLVTVVKTGRPTRDLLAFQKAVKGTYDFVAQVKGSALSPSLKRLADAAFTAGVLASDDLFEQFLEPRRAAHRFAVKLERVNSWEGLHVLERGALATRVLERHPTPAGLLSLPATPQAGDEDPRERLQEAKNELLRSVCTGLLLSARYTARFFRAFSARGSFGELIHPPTSGDGPPSDEVMERCKLHLAHHRERLPYQLHQKIARFLEACSQFLQATPGVHPWDDREFLVHQIIPFKQGIILDEDPSSGTDLVALLRELTRHLPAKIEVHGLRSLFADVEALRKGLQPLLASLGARQDLTVLLAPLAEAGADRVQVYRLSLLASSLRSQDERSLPGFFTEHPSLHEALLQLRGQVDWTVSIEHADGGFALFDVMKNRRLRLRRGASGVQHHLTFYRYRT